MSSVCMKVGANSCVHFKQLIKQLIRRCNPQLFPLIIAFNSLICRCFLCVSFLKIWEITIQERCNPHKMLLIYRENPYRSLHIVRLYILVVVLGDPFLWFQFCTCVVGVCNPHFLLMYLVFAPTIGILELLGCIQYKATVQFQMNYTLLISSYQSTK